MKNLQSFALCLQNNELSILDQQLLPHEKKWITVENCAHMVEIIKTLKTRGAPLIGVAASLSLALSYFNHPDLTTANQNFDLLSAARPTAVNLTHCLSRVLTCINETKHPELVLQTAIEIFEEDVNLCRAIGQHGANKIDDGDSILTHCNAGSLATVGIGTAIGVITSAFQQGKKIHVYVDETRPLLQGARLTAYELDCLGIPYTLICDNMAASLMAENKIQKIIVGADRIAMNGDFANKIGTYNLAVLAHFHHIPFYTAAPYTTIDKHAKTGNDIIIEQRQAAEVKGISWCNYELTWAPHHAPTYNPAFDVTPNRLVTGIITDRGIFNDFN